MANSKRSGANHPHPLARCLLLAAAVAGALGGRAAATEHVSLGGAASPRIVNGITTHAYPTVGALLYSPFGPINEDTASLRCSGTLIGCQTFLTAGHCVGDPDPAHYLVFLQHAGLFAVSAVHRHPAYAYPDADVAVLTLTTPVTGIDPTPITLVDPFPFIPASGTIVGYGQSAGGAFDYGIKRAGAVQTLSCPIDAPATDTELVCWDFTNPIGPPGQDSNTCNGDSGGPLFLDLGGGDVVAGITSGGTSLSCLPIDHSYDANVYTYRSFVLAQLGGDATSACGGLPPIGAVQDTVTAVGGALDAGHSSDSYAVGVASGANALRVVLNGEDNGIFDADLYVKHGPGAGPGNFDCKADGNSVYGGCLMDLPAGGTWSMRVERVAGSGAYQLTTTVFGGAPPQCGNDAREFNETCDGTDDMACRGLCRSDCTCPPPQCGNGVTEVGEVCDGADANACPGQCSAGCTCPPPCAQGALYRAKARLDAARFKFRSTLLNFSHLFDGADPRQRFTLVLTQGAATVTVDIAANDPGWSSSDPARRRFKWIGSLGGITRVKAIDRSASRGTWKIIVVGKAVAGAGAIDVNLPLDVKLSIEAACVEDSF